MVVWDTPSPTIQTFCLDLLMCVSALSPPKTAHSDSALVRLFLRSKENSPGSMHGQNSGRQ